MVPKLPPVYAAGNGPVGGIGPEQRFIAVLVIEPSAWVISNVPQKENAVLVEPVLLLIPRVKFLVKV